MQLPTKFFNKKELLSKKVSAYLEDSYFDIQGLGPGMPNIDEAYLARVLTKIAVGSATVWWSLLELKDFVRIRSTIKNKGPLNDLSRKDSF